MILLATTAIVLTGCFNVSAEELYSLPELSEENLQLQRAIDMVLAGGAEYSPPTAGKNRQSIQLRDLDGDGINEALAFFSTMKEKPLKIYIFKNNGTTYENVAVIEGDGTSIDRIAYEDLDGDGIKEIIVGWQLEMLKMMDIYSIKDYNPVRLEGSDYQRVIAADINGNGNLDVVALRQSNSDVTVEVKMFSIAGDGEVETSSARLSEGIDSIFRLTSGKLSDGGYALFVESIYMQNSVITDVITWRGSSLANITLRQTENISAETMRDYNTYGNNMYSTDINDDGVMEVPFVVTMQSQSENAVYRAVDWYTYSSAGARELVMTTYHNYSDGWYLELPEQWRGNISVRRDDSVAGERTVIFSYGHSGSYVDFLKIYTLSGDNKEERSRLEGRFLLKSGATIYSGEILDTGEQLPITVDIASVASWFNLIISDWGAG